MQDMRLLLTSLESQLWREPEIVKVIQQSLKFRACFDIFVFLICSHQAYNCRYLNCWRRHRNFCWLRNQISELVICVERHKSETLISISVSTHIHLICVNECICWSKHFNLHYILETPTISKRSHLMCVACVWGASPLRHTLHNSSVYVLKLFEVQEYSQD